MENEQIEEMKREPELKKRLTKIEKYIETEIKQQRDSGVTETSEQFWGRIKKMRDFATRRRWKRSRERQEETMIWIRGVGCTQECGIWDKEEGGRGSRRQEQEAKETVEIQQSGKNLSEEGGLTEIGNSEENST
jgi:hypothetical protein